MDITNVSSLDDLKQAIHHKLQLVEDKTVSKIHFRCPIQFVGGCSHYMSYKLQYDNDMMSLFDTLRQHPILTSIELYATIEDTNTRS